MAQPSSRRLRPSVAWFLAGVLLLTACGDDGEEPEASGDGEASEATGEEDQSGAEAAADQALRIHVTNDDGVRAPGIDVVVEALTTLEDVDLFVIGPAEDQSGSGDRMSTRLPEGVEAETLGGHAATAVQGTPADSVAWAHEELFVGEQEPPHLTVSGSNAGQNHGGLAYLSGTVGATRESARRGVPGFAISQQLGDPPDYEAGLPFLLEWVEEHREELLAGDLGLDTITSLNVPTCEQGEVRDMVETTRDTRGQDQGGPDVLGPSDCTSDTPAEGLSDVEAFHVGFATLTEVDIEAPPT